MYPKHTVADVLNLEVDHLKELANTSWHLRTLHAIRKCRTKALGGHLDWCTACGKLHLQFNPCRNRHCPTWQEHKQQQWLGAREKELLPVAYFHVVFTIPHHLNAISLGHPNELYKILFDSVRETISSFCTKELGTKMGMIAVLHTWGKILICIASCLKVELPKQGIGEKEKARMIFCLA